MPKNYYLVLGITSDATPADIKQAYRRLAKELHPDHYGANQSPFLDIQEAYSVLTDPVRKQHHDLSMQKVRARKIQTQGSRTTMRNSSRPVEPLIPEQEPVNLGTAHLAKSFHTYRPSFDGLFDKILRNFLPTDLPRHEKIEELNSVITLTPEQALRGGQIRIAIPAQMICPTCSGRGSIGPYDCWRCSGEGILTGEYPVMIQYPPGIGDRHQVSLPLDQYGIKNLYFTVIFRISDIF